MKIQLKLHALLAAIPSITENKIIAPTIERIANKILYIGENIYIKIASIRNGTDKNSFLIALPVVKKTRYKNTAVNNPTIKLAVGANK